MTLLNKLRCFFTRPFFTDPRTIAGLWLIIVIVTFLTKGAFNPAKCNNFLIFRGVFFHTIDQLPLFAAYPDEYADVNHYGPVFSLVIAPFALLPRVPALLLWNLCLAASLFRAIRTLPVSAGHKGAISWIVSLELLSALQMQQFNIAIAAIVAATYTAVRNDRPGVAAFLVALGTLTKLYGIVGLAFIPFMRRKWRSAGWLLLWTAVLFAAPMLISSPEYICSQYADWFHSLVDKNAANGFAANDLQNISAIGLIHRVSGLSFSDLWILVPAGVLFLLPFARVKEWKNHTFQWGIVASVLMCIILFSTGSESSGYVIAFLGVAIWFTQLPPTEASISGPHGSDTEKRQYYWKIGLLVFAIIVCCFGGSDLMPRAIRKGLIRPYALKALPVLLIWLSLTATLLFHSLRPSLHQSRASRRMKEAQ